MADPAAAVHVAKVKRFLLNGALHGLPYGSIEQNGFVISSFSLVGKAQSMGKVSGSLDLANPFIAHGKLPNLSGARLTLFSQQGAVQLMMASSPSHRYVFVVTSGTGSYASVSGSGIAMISFKRRMLQFEVKLHSSVR
jgi:hypothetical protein